MLYGDDVVDESKQRMSGWSKDDVEEIQAQASEAHERIAALMDAEVPPDDPRTLDAIDLHYLGQHVLDPERGVVRGLAGSTSTIRGSPRPSMSLVRVSRSTCATRWRRTRGFGWAFEPVGEPC